MQRKKYLESLGFIIGKREPRLNTDYNGNFMVSQPYEESDLPTKDGSQGPWCIVGDDLESLIDEAYQTFKNGDISP